MAVFDVLSEHSLQNVLGALQVHARRSRFAPTPADVFEIIGDRTGQKHIGADEAWGLALESFDEAATVIITQQIAEARGLVADIYHTGDTTGARMAFRSAYERITTTAAKPKWFVSAGFDAARRTDAVQKAIQLGRLPANEAMKYQIEAATETVAGLIESAADHPADAAYREKTLSGIKKLKAMLAAPGDDGIAGREEARLEFEAKRREELARIKTSMTANGESVFNHSIEKI